MGDFAVTSINDRENFPFVRVQQGDFSVTQQVVAGILYKFSDVTLLATDCKKGSNTDPSDCNIVDNPIYTMVCSFTVLSQPWEDPQYQLLDWGCPSDQTNADIKVSK